MDLATCSGQGCNMTAKIPTVIGLGRLVDFIIRDAQGKRLRVTPVLYNNDKSKVPDAAGVPTDVPGDFIKLP